MLGELIQTKLYIPQLRPFFIPRRRLIKRLDQGLQNVSKLTLVSAPAGFGKSSLITDWGRRMTETLAPKSRITNPKLCWLSLDSYDNDPNRFWQYLVAALRTIVPHLGATTQRLLSSTPLPPPPALLTSLLNELAALAEQIIVVLDDYHLIADASIHEGLNFLLDHAPSQLHLILITRADPPGSNQTDYAQALLRAFPDDMQSVSSALVEPLSPRELEVLQLIAAGLTNKQITAELIISLNTVKKHTTHIYSKLGVNSRTQAIARARELHLV